MIGFMIAACSAGSKNGEGALISSCEAAAWYGSNVWIDGSSNSLVAGNTRLGFASAA